MLVTLLKRWDKTPQLVSISNTSHSGLLNLQLRADTAITAFLKAHTGLEFTNLWGIIFNSWENLKKNESESETLQPLQCIQQVMLKALCAPLLSVCLSVCVFSAQMPVTSLCPLLWTNIVNTTFLCGSGLWRGPLTSPVLAFVFPSLVCQWSNKVTSKTDGKEMSGVVKVKNEPQR